MKEHTDEYLMGVLEEFEQQEHSFALDGKEEEAEAVHVAALAIYNELNRRGWKWSDREKDWVKA